MSATLLRKLAARLLTVALLLSVLGFSTQGVAHSHGVTHDEDGCTCQVCHIGHAAIPQPTHSAQSQSSLLVARFVSAEESEVAAQAVTAPSIPRAPPA
jgi:hypothetical protein